MSVLISIHAGDFRHFLIQLRRNHGVLVSDSRVSFRILRKVDLTGKEKRPFTDSEKAKVLRDYSYFKDYFTKEGIWFDESTDET
jgi:hypothetical protein